MASLRERFQPRRNSLDAMRLVLALVVLGTHSIDMRTGSQPTWGNSTLGDMAVDGFFILSGFLVTRSYLRLNSFTRFAWHRFLRIMPAFWVCLLVTGLVFAPLVAVLEGSSVSQPFITSPSAFRYIIGNSSLYITQYDIGGLMADNPAPSVFNGSLWTLTFEAICYVIVGLAGLTGVLRSKPILIPVMAGGVWVLSIAYDAGFNTIVGDLMLRLVFLFLLGAAAHLYAHRIPMSPVLALAGVAVFLLSVGSLENYRTVGAVPLAYALLWLCSCFPKPISLRVDFSYGVYIYHWPVLQILASSHLVGLPQTAFLAVGLLLTLVMAALSWFLVEKPALDRKNNNVPHNVDRALQRAATAARATSGDS